MFISECVKENTSSEVDTKKIYHSYQDFCSEFDLKEDSPIGFWKKWKKHAETYFPKAIKKQRSGGGEGTYYLKGITLTDVADI
ncbi:MAG: hypothetical protein DRN27_09510 [Thermoplasmata archaeon]|nr:MAG: hypothetical protein DRN27_09510 [Thermoplasmata archaeon]